MKRLPAGSKTIPLFVILLLALFLRVPFLQGGLPYFYQEDEGHHFNRTIEMLKSGDLNPHYFHKPSLHFYIRLPFAAVGFLDAVRSGEIRSVKEIKTRDPAGLAGYSFTASHPRIVVWTRLPSLIAGLLLVVLAFLIGEKITAMRLGGVIAGLFTALAPPLIEDSCKIGVDTLTAFFALLTVWVVLSMGEYLRPGKFLLAALFAGLALSTKYNAAPIWLFIIAVPFLYRDLSIGALLIALFIPPLGFLLGSPAIITSLPLFLDQFAYEIWHYGIAGHAGHMAEPGIPQMFFYLDWLRTEVFGIPALILSLVGVFSLLKEKRGYGVAFLLFPLCFALLMVSQRANFTRNMVPFLPFLAILIALGIAALAKLRFPGKGIVIFILFGLALYLPAWQSWRIQKSAWPTESRVAFIEYLRGNNLRHVAVDKELQIVQGKSGTALFTPIDVIAADAVDLSLQGFSSLALPQWKTLQSPQLVLRNSFAGEALKLRPIQNPAIHLYDLKPAPAAILAERLNSLPGATVSLPLLSSKDEFIQNLNCTPSLPDEPYCWLTLRHHRILLPEALKAFLTTHGNEDVILHIKVMTPWPTQQVILRVAATEQKLTLPATPGAWDVVPFTFSAQALLTSDLFVEQSEIASPAEAGLSSDGRRLGTAVAGIYMEGVR
jgi:hypothetical protein